jgi:hypothetical protein
MNSQAANMPPSPKVIRETIELRTALFHVSMRRT